MAAIGDKYSAQTDKRKESADIRNAFSLSSQTDAAKPSETLRPQGIKCGSSFAQQMQDYAEGLQSEGEDLGMWNDDLMVYLFQAIDITDPVTGKCIAVVILAHVKYMLDERGLVDITKFKPVIQLGDITFGKIDNVLRLASWEDVGKWRLSEASSPNASNTMRAFLPLPTTLTTLSFSSDRLAADTGICCTPVSVGHRDKLWQVIHHNEWTTGLSADDYRRNGPVQRHRLVNLGLGRKRATHIIGEFITED
ncbi:hypothetical protein V8B97DRAFT_1917699 [Scleroderma yunnanense]